ncbi:tyrosine-type recombinase/integrase [Reichenbachiella versicolor]|uniref:tyrosine-type recombinase/integrase n=1 Tax=Reichenbachiella versicolor TaxID=1821036 RepID=UPI000D6E9811|nr:tyrosine-type recombinase/integrase [Reichenbachiella versicolor]
MQLVSLYKLGLSCKTFATEQESGMDIQNIQMLLGHNSTKNTEIYTHVANSNFVNIKNPLDLT